MATGIITPFVRDQKGDWANGSGADLIRSKVAQALGTRRGELAWHTNRGSRLHLLRHKSLPDAVMRDAARVYAEEALAEELTDIAVRDVEITRSKDGNGLLTVTGIRVTYDVVDPNTGNVKLARQLVEVPQI